MSLPTEDPSPTEDNMQELFSKDPASLTHQELDSIIFNLRQKREAFLLKEKETKTPKEAKKPKTPKTAATKADMDDLLSSLTASLKKD